MSRAKANVNPQMLVWARGASGFSVDEAARKLGISVEKLKKWESGEDKPTFKQLEHIGHLYHRPTAMFYLKEQPSNPPTIPDFRVPYGEDGDSSPELLYEIRQAFERRETALELMEGLQEKSQEYPIKAHLHESPETVAARIRALIGIGIDDQLSWGTDNEALNKWIAAIERMGVLVFHATRVPIEQMRGFSITEPVLPVITINIKDSIRGRIFTLFHELTHVALRNGGICDLRRTSNRHDRVEIFCNNVAGEVLVPRYALLDEELVKEKRKSLIWADWELNRLANRFKVSQEVILRRLLVLGRTSREFYEEKRRLYETEYSRQRERGKKGGYMPYEKKIVRMNGRTYTGLVLSAYQNNVIGLYDVSTYLGGIKLTHLGKIENELVGH
ncbi:helix-turn-helix domain-containing protein [Alicyclobacillus herbarius]|uniref:helix-turn-helix domain-containing protein n=1 Tax=Alicyclobacillus herbarius TaxID=122960 RepID=UPI0003F6B357|nr:ImmA/IrrE family metallo-endopeptidase [Alicyclobacillus herbarius]